RERVGRTEPAGSVGGHLGGLAGLLVFGEDVDATLVARLLRPRGGEERVDDGQRLLGGVHAAADADELGIVVLAGQLGGLDAPGEGTSGAGHLVGGDLLAVAGTAEDQAEAARIGDGAASGLDAEGRVVVLGVVFQRAAVHDIVARLLEMSLDVVLQFETGMVGTKVYAHGCDCRRSPRARCQGDQPRIGSVHAVARTDTAAVRRSTRSLRAPARVGRAARDTAGVAGTSVPSASAPAPGRSPVSGRIARAAAAGRAARAGAVGHARPAQLG